MLAIIGYALNQVDRGKYTAADPAYPIVRLQRLIQKPRIDGIAAGTPIEIAYTVVEDGVCASGGSGWTTRDLYFKVFPKGSCSLPGVIIGFPVLDAAPYGLGLVTQPTVHAFSALQVALPRLELSGRTQYRVIAPEWRALNWIRLPSAWRGST